MIEIVWSGGAAAMDAWGAFMVLGPLVLTILGTIILKHQGWG